MWQGIRLIGNKFRRENSVEIYSYGIGESVRQVLLLREEMDIL